MRLAPLLAVVFLAGCFSPDPGAGGDRLWALACGVRDCNVKATISNGPANEVHLAQDPTDPYELVVGAKDYTLGPEEACGMTRVWAGVYRTTDGARTWANGLLPGNPGDAIENALSGYQCVSDPQIVFAKDGTLYYTGLAMKYEGDPLRGVRAPGAHVFVARADENVSTWKIVPVFEAPDADEVFTDDNELFQDKQWMTIDPASGALYMVWSPIRPSHAGTAPIAALEPSLQPVLFSRSRDRGETWTKPLALSTPTTGVWPALPAVGAEGRVHVLMVDYVEEALYLSTSADAGDAFGAPTQIRAFSKMPENRPTQADGTFRTLTVPAFVADLGEGPHHGRLHVVWMDYGTGDADVLAIHSDDGGATWSEPVRVNDDPTKNGKDQLFPAAAVAPDGTLHVVFYDRRDDPENRLLHVYHAASSDGGASFERNLRLTDRPTDAAKSFHQDGTNFIGDYIGVTAAIDDEAWAVWTDTREGRADAFVAKVARPLG